MQLRIARAAVMSTYGLALSALSRELNRSRTSDNTCAPNRRPNPVFDILAAMIGTACGIERRQFAQPQLSPASTLTGDLFEGTASCFTEDATWVACLDVHHHMTGDVKPDW
ncbi:hypothetical protein C9413_23340 [Rhizobium sp. SEMIA 4085]|nr:MULTISPECIES: hypothetical protein [Rhizobium]NNH32291.1 hypothetical protein [Rhizobium sp. SEMIA 4085]